MEPKQVRSARLKPQPSRQQQRQSAQDSENRSYENEKSAARVEKKSKSSPSTQSSRAAVRVMLPAPKPKKKAKKRIQQQTAHETLTDFLPVIATNSKAPVLIGIDPGTKGAIAFRCGAKYCVVDIPRIETKKKRSRRTNAEERKRTGNKSKTVMCTEREPDLEAIVQLFSLLDDEQFRVHVLLERIPPTIGKRGRKYAEIMLNRAYAMWPLFLHAKGYKVTQERPSIWKESFKLLGADKDEGRKLALKLHPAADITRKKDHDRGDALLLVEYLRRTLQKGSK